METPLVLSIFPGIDLLGMGFELEGFCVVKGPDVLFGQTIIDWHVPQGIFQGVIGGPPCQAHSLARGNNPPSQPNLIPEFERIVTEAWPMWFLMECVERAPAPKVEGYHTTSFFVQAAELGLCHRRKRKITVGSLIPALIFEVKGEMNKKAEPCIMATEYKSAFGGHRWRNRIPCQKRYVPDIAERMGLPRDWDAPAFKLAFKYQVLGNGVPIPVSRILARIIKTQLIPGLETAP